MENMQKALVMAGSVLMFIIALSVGIYSYTSVTETVKSLLSISENNARTAEYFVEDQLDVERTITRAEVVQTILSMKDKDYTADQVNVNGSIFNKTDFLTPSGTYEIERKLKNIPNLNYSISYEITEYNPDYPTIPGKVCVVYTAI